MGEIMGMMKKQFRGKIFVGEISFQVNIFCSFGFLENP